MQLLQWLMALVLAAFAGRLVSKIKLPSILGWLIIGMLLGPHALGLMPQPVLDAVWYKTVIMWMQCAFGLMLGTELVWKELKSYGKGLTVTTLTQSLGTFCFVTLVFAIVLWLADVPVYLAFLFGGIALATAPAPALSIVNEFHAKGPVTNTLLPMAVLDDIVAIIVFFTVNSIVASSVSGGSVPLYMIPVMVLLPVIIGLVTGLPAGWLLNRVRGRVQTLAILLAGITLTVGIGWLINTKILSGITLKKCLGLTLLPHSGVSLVFTGIACATLASQPELIGILQGTIAAAAVINEIIAVIAAKKGFELAIVQSVIPVNITACIQYGHGMDRSSNILIKKHIIPFSITFILTCCQIRFLTVQQHRLVIAQFFSKVFQCGHTGVI